MIRLPRGSVLFVTGLIFVGLGLGLNEGCLASSSFLPFLFALALWVGAKFRRQEQTATFAGLFLYGVMLSLPAIACPGFGVPPVYGLLGAVAAGCMVSAVVLGVLSAMRNWGLRRACDAQESAKRRTP